MIFNDDNEIKVGGKILQGVIKNYEIKVAAMVEEQEVEGSAVKPKQATGYEDGKINIDLILIDDVNTTKEVKMQTIHNIFKDQATLQSKPEVLDFVNEHAAIRGINKVIFKSMNTRYTNKRTQIEVSLEFWQYVAVTIVAKKATSTGSSVSSNTVNNNNGLTREYNSYLSNNRGSAASNVPTLTGNSSYYDFKAGGGLVPKTNKTPIIDNW